MINKVEICGVDTSKLPILKEKRMNELFGQIHKGSKRAREEFIRGNLRLVLSVIQRFNNRGENVDDLFQVGTIGLMKAIDNFDLKHGVKFSTYAVPMIIGEIRRYLRDNNSIRVSRSLRDTAYKALQIRNTIANKKMQEPSMEEVAKMMEMKLSDVCYALDAIQDPVSLFEPVFNDGSDTVYAMDQIRDEKNKEEFWIEDLAIKEALVKLNDREKSIIDLRFFKGKTQMEVANEIGISQAQVSRLEKTALKCMHKNIKN